eukprot:CAMPEP_0197592944 /NCGR_PEP_ID=MMETSP1326-20131121/16581_1 /TAXON_ID=1155430 /ORGANISM="Genus nov. species nov., Strain RCC2288" /LENGTH=84 /DNA_ID=CAMNT_0043158783 /DNA_START=301 /DNA_END=556 /DNA_ORIENTATION=-
MTVLDVTTAAERVRGDVVPTADGGAGSPVLIVVVLSNELATRARLPRHRAAAPPFAVGQTRKQIQRKLPENFTASGFIRALVHT